MTFDAGGMTGARPRGEARPGWDLIGQLGRSLGYAMGWKSLAELHRAMPAGSFATSAPAAHATPPGEKRPDPRQPSAATAPQKKEATA